MTNSEFAGKTALIIGGSSSVGKQIALNLAEMGCIVYVTGRTAPNEKNLKFIQLDFESEGLELLERAEIEEVLKNTDILCVCYGPFVYKPLHETLLKDWKNVALYDYALPGICVSKVLENMQCKKWGRIVLFGGTRTAEVKNYKMNAAYAGAKTGVSVLVKSTACEYANEGITCNAILPGFTRNAPEGTEEVSEKCLADHAVYLMSHSELNGVLFTVDRGWSPR